MSLGSKLQKNSKGGQPKFQNWPPRTPSATSMSVLLYMRGFCHTSAFHYANSSRCLVPPLVQGASTFLYITISTLTNVSMSFQVLRKVSLETKNVFRVTFRPLGSLLRESFVFQPLSFSNQKMCVPQGIWRFDGLYVLSPSCNEAVICFSTPRSYPHCG